MGETGTYTFGNNELYQFERYAVKDNKVIQGFGLAKRTTINPDVYFAALEDINASFQIITDPQTNKHFEIAIANLNATSDTVDAEISTFTSSISGSIGHAIEFAEHSASQPHRRRVYIASFGNGGSSYWESAEQKYIKKTGRFTTAEGEPLPTVAALERALRVADLAISRLSTNSAGGAYATSLMTALPEGQVSHAYIKNRPNISNHPMGLFWGLMLAKADKADDKRYKEVSTDPWRMSANIIRNARPLLADIYVTPTGDWRPKSAVTSRGLQKLYIDAVGLSRGGKRFGHPAAQDTALALRDQPDATVTYHFSEQDRSYNNIRKDLAIFLGAITHMLPTADFRLEALITPGTHRDHTQYPSLRWTMEQYAFAK